MRSGGNMGQEHKQITPAEILNKLVAKTDKKGDFVAYRGEIEKLQVRMSALLSACREVAREVNAAAAKNVPPAPVQPPRAAVQESAPAVKESAPAAPAPAPAAKATPPAPEAKTAAPAARPAPAQPRPQSTTRIITPSQDDRKRPAFGGAQKGKPGLPSYVKGVANINLNPETRKKPAPRPENRERQTGSERPPRLTGSDRPFSGRTPAPSYPPVQANAPKTRKAGDKKKDSSKSMDEKKVMTKRTLIRKGFMPDDIDEDRVRVRKLRNKKKSDQPTVAPKAIDNVTITTNQVTVKMLSELIGVPAQEIMKKMLMMGGKPVMSINDVVDFDTLYLVADSFGVTLNQKIAQSQEELAEALHEEADDEKDLVPRPPVITVMGHVDHGKTSLLDAIRKTNVAEGEAGGITQHIGAYSVTWEYEKKKRLITFLDTPGHEAFTEMRARGTKVTDIVILVVAADDGVQPQTIEAINHVKAAGVPMIVAINKIDKPGANPERIKEELSQYGVVTDEWGGDTKMVPISAKKNIGIDTLLEEILFLADLNNYRANPNRKAKGAIIEARLDKGKGPIATILVQNGTLHSGDAVVCGLTYGKIRSMADASGKVVKSAPPSTAVSVMGLSGVPNAGDDMWVVDDEKTAKEIVDGRIEKDKIAHSEDRAIKSFETNALKDLNVIIKADVQGSAEALKSSIAKLANEEAKVNIVHCGVGAINKSDMMLAEVTNAYVIGFNVKPDAEARIIAEHSGIRNGTFSVIYDAIDAIEAALGGMTEPKYEDRYTGKAEVRSIFKISSVGTVAGSYVLDGKIQRGAKVIVKRGGKTIYEGKLGGLKRFKDDVKEVSAGYECGISIDGYSDFAEGDEIEAYISERVK